MSDEEEESKNETNDNKLPSTETWRDVSIKRALKIDVKNKDTCSYCGEEFSNRRFFVKHIKTHNKNCVITSKKISKKKKKK